MTQQPPQAAEGGIDNQKKSPDDWVTGDQPMTGAQASYLKTLCEETGDEFDHGLSKAEASKRIDANMKASGVSQGQSNS